VSDAAISASGALRLQLGRGLNDWHRRLPGHNAQDLWGLQGLAVGDVDGDGLEDLYIGESKGVPNALLLQRDGGQLDDAAGQWGVDWLESCHAALLVDLDNDGDQDLVTATAGAVLVASNEGENDGFVIQLGLPMPYQTTHLAAADYDRDGRLDIYACAYHRDSKLEDNSPSLGSSYLNFNKGAPNKLFRNTSEGVSWAFEDVTEVLGLDVDNARLSLAASWEDVDNDGDLDLYVANDFGKNSFYRHDRAADGTSRFREVAALQGGEDSGFGMSIAWGDFNRDGFFDGYVSNMWSAAGKRIVTQDKFRPGLDDERRAFYLRFAKGNSLWQNDRGSRFVDTSGPAGVEMGRWAWAAPFVDLNNDGWEDLVVANGYITGDSKAPDL
jgi:hypothetical protein